MARFSERELLERVDEWYSKVVERNYIPIIEAELANIVLTAIEELVKLNSLPLEQEAIDKFVAGVKDGLRKEKIIEASQNAFSKSRAYVAEGLEGGGKLGLLLTYANNYFGEEVTAQCKDKLRECLSLYDALAGNVASAAGSSSLDELADSDIEKAYLATFNGHHGFIKLLDSYEAAVWPVVDACVSAGFLTEKTRAAITDVYEKLKCIIQNYEENIFSAGESTESTAKLDSLLR